MQALRPTLPAFLPPARKILPTAGDDWPWLFPPRVSLPQKLTALARPCSCTGRTHALGLGREANGRA